MYSKNNHFFPGGNTVYGFFNYYQSILSDNSLKKIYTIKGGPGVGKSTFMKDIAKHFESLGESIEYYHCSSDPDSLDGVLLKEKKMLFTDGTAPHIIDPVYPGVLYELINLATFFDSQKLSENKEEIINLTDEISELFQYSYSYLKSLKNIKASINNQFKKAVKSNDLNTFSSILIKKIIKNKQGHGFEDQKLFISAITPHGLKNFTDRSVNCENIYVLKTNECDMSYKIIEKIKEKLISKEFKIRSFYCPTSPDSHPEHLLIPELDTAIITSNKYHPCYKGEEIETAHLYDYNKISLSDIEYDRTLYNELINRCIEILRKAKSAHDTLEKYYISAMDYDKLNQYKVEFTKSISK